MVDAARLDRIIARCSADLQAPADFEGSGALITWRRATAVRMLQDGHHVASVADATDLSPARVSEVATNVRTHGVEALAPSFDEPTPAQVSDADRDAIRSAVGEVGIRRLSVEVLADRVVGAGLVEDISVATLGELIGFTGRRTARSAAPLAVATTRRIRRWALLGGLLFAVAYLVSPLSFLALWAIAFAALFLLPLLLALYGAWSAIRKRRLRRAVEDLSTTTAWPAPLPAPPDSEHADGTSERPRIEVLNASALPEPAALPPPLVGEVLYLWIFDASWSQLDLLRGGWAELAPTRMLTNVDILSSTATRGAMSRPRDSIIADTAQLAGAIDALPTDFGTHGSPDLNVKRRSRRYVGYPITPLICTAGMWHAAFDALLERSGLVVVNLSGFEQAHEGLAHELRHVLRPPSPALEVFLIDADSDADGAIEFVTQIASDVGAASPLVFVRTPAPDPLPSWSDIGNWLRNTPSSPERDRTPDLADRVYAHLCR